MLTNGEFFDMIKLVEKLYKSGDLSDEELTALIETNDAEAAGLLRSYADEVRRKYYRNKVFLRGLIEISSYCKNDCYYCGIRRGNKNAERYRLDHDQVMNCAETARMLGMRTFVLQGGEDAFFTDDYLCTLIKSLKSSYPDCAVTLSLGERPYESYKKLREAGADRYLLRHEAASHELYSRLHPQTMSLDDRKKCLFDLKELGYQVGAGFMVGAPFQTTADLVCDLRFMQELQPQMIGIGAFIPHHDTPFRDEKGGTLEQTIRLLGMIRLMFPKVLLPATTALGTISPNGRILGLQTGCNVVMPNFSPQDVRKKYMLYDNKPVAGGEAAEGLSQLCREIEAAGYTVAKERGDYIGSEG